MKFIITLIQNYISIAIVSIILIVVVFGAVLFLYEKNRAEMQLLEAVKDFIQYQNQLIQIPQGWDIEADYSCLQSKHYSMQFVKQNGLYRKIVYPYTYHDTSFCISKQVLIQWTIYHNLMLLIVTIVCVGFWVLLYSRVWKYIVHIQHVCKSADFEYTHNLGLIRLQEMLQMYHEKKHIKAMLYKEFAVVFAQLKNDIGFNLEQKKIPDTCYQEFLQIYNML